MPAPKNPAHLTELTTLASKLTAAYGGGKYCKDANEPSSCRNLDDLSEVLANDRDWDRDLDAWVGWHKVGRGMLQGLSALRRAAQRRRARSRLRRRRRRCGAPATTCRRRFRKETDRLWGQVQPLYDELQCYARGKLAAKYGERMPKDGTIPAHITGNMWAQDWANLYPLLQPYPGVGNLDVDRA